jgi:hypothetical protein
VLEPLASTYTSSTPPLADSSHASHLEPFDQAPRWVAKAGEFVDLKEVYPPVPDADKIQIVEMDDLSEKAYAKKKQEYKKLFLR